MALRIARIGTLTQPVPAQEYGGIQRSMAQMTAFQAALLGHEVTVYASADSSIVPFTAQIAHSLGLPCALSRDGKTLHIKNADGRTGFVRLRDTGQNAMGYNHVHADKCQADLIGLFLCDEKKRPYDVIHSHYADLTARFLLPRGLGGKTLTHQHTGTLPAGYPDKRFPLICISTSQSALLREKYNANVVAVIPHGLDAFTHQFSPQHAGYAAWIGRFLEEKGAHRAVAIARQAGMPLVMAGMVYNSKPASLEHFSRDIEPLVDIHDPELLDRMNRMSPYEVSGLMRHFQDRTGKPSPVIFVGAANDQQKQMLYGYATATLFPISWPEPFGRVMIESMACGTPVVANARFGDIHCGAVDEVIADGVTGYLVSSRSEADGIRQAAAALTSAAGLDRKTVRAVFDRDWTSARVARQIGDVYATLPPLQKPNKSTPKYHA